MLQTRFSRHWAMPSPCTFDIAPIRELIASYLRDCSVVVDPFARNSMVATVRNDLNPNTSAQFHMDAAEFCDEMHKRNLVADAVLFDPPYSPRQIAEVYQQIGRQVQKSDTQNSHLYKKVRDGLTAILRPGGLALSFGWNSSGFGISRGFEPIEIMMVAHGGAHNDTICVVEKLVKPDTQCLFSITDNAHLV